MATAHLAEAQRLVLYGIDWKTYLRLVRAFAERPSIRLTYDRGVLEIMSPLLEHDTDGDFLGVLARILTEELNLPIMGGGSTTLRRRRKRRGLEPDRCYWIANESKMRGKRAFDPHVDPPPDLAIEIDVTNSSLDRMDIYAALKVPEVWRLDNQALTFHVLGPDGHYCQVPQSQVFPGLMPTDLVRFLNLRTQMDENAVIRQFRAWVQQRIAAGWK